MNEKFTPESLALFAEAWILLAVARMMLVFRPFSKILPVLKDGRSNDQQQDMALLQMVKLSIARAVARSPWRTKCFEQALAARMMLKRRGIATITYFGVLKTADDKMEAHAWLKSGEFVVTGWRRMGEYTVVAEVL
jgi:hypothetical protein